MRFALLFSASRCVRHFRTTILALYAASTLMRMGGLSRFLSIICCNRNIFILYDSGGVLFTTAVLAMGSYYTFPRTCAATKTFCLSYAVICRYLGAAAYAAGLVALCLGLHSGWGLRSLGGAQGAWTLTAVVVAIFVGVVSQGLGRTTAKKRI